MDQPLPPGTKSFQVLIRTKEQVDNLIVAPVWLPTFEEAEEFGKLSVKVLRAYVWLDAWKITPTEHEPTHMFHSGELIRLNGRLQ
jgi:hypothetical protein